METKKIIQFLKYLAAFALGFITNFSGILDNISSIPSSYQELKRVYFYSGNQLAGSWSNNTEYMLGSGNLGVTTGPTIIMQIDVNEHDEIRGEILSEAICEALPLTWVISVESPEPGPFSILSSRKLYIKQLRNNLMETVAIMELTSVDERKGTISLKKEFDAHGMLPETITLAKNTPAFSDDFNHLSDFCAESSQRLREKIKSMRN